MKLEIIESIGMDVLHGFFAMLDSVIYGLMALCYEFIDSLTCIRLNEGIIGEIAGRIYVALGIFMLFKVSWSFINYIINPDTLTDKEKGVQNVIKNIIIMFAMLLVCPWAFDQLYDVQSALLKDDVVGNLIFGTTAEDSSKRQFQMSDICGDNYVEIEIANQNQKGDFLALTLFKPFYQPKVNTLLEMGSDAQGIYCTPSANDKGHITVGSYLKNEVYNDAPGAVTGTYSISYLFGISTVVGVIALLIIISMLIDISLRAVKLMFFQLIAPVPIISYIEPSSSKNGMFKKWLSAVGSTWASLFVRLFAFNFAIYMIQIFTMPDGNIFEACSDKNLFVDILLIIGALMFAKQLPKLISDITGFKMDGSFSINPLKKVQDQALGGKTALGLGAAAAAAGMSGGANLVTAFPRAFNKNTWRDREGKVTGASVMKGLSRTIGSPIGGAFSAGYRTFGKVSKDGKIGAGIKGGHLEAMFAKQQREDLERRGSTFGGRIAADANRWIGTLNEAQQNVLDFDDRDKKISAWEDSIKQRKEQESAGFKEYSDILGSMKGKIDAQRNVKEALDAIEAAKQNGAYFHRDGTKTTIAKNLEDNLNRQRSQAYADRKNDADIVAWQNRLKELVNDPENDNLRNYSINGMKVDDKGNTVVDLKSLYDAKAELTAVETRYAREENQLAEAKVELAQDKASYNVRAAEANNASRKINGPQPEGWKPSTNVNAGTATGFGPNEYYTSGDYRGNNGGGRPPRH